MSEEERRRRKNARRWCRRKFSLVDAICECGYMAATERHHVNGDVTDNRPANIRLLCDSCHDSQHTGERWYADRDPSRWVSNGGCGAVLPFSVAAAK